MGAVVQESYSPKYMAASGLVLGTRGGAIGGFLATTAGNVKLTYTDGAGATICDVPVTAGVFTPMPFAITGPVYATLSGGATGTFAAL